MSDFSLQRPSPSLPTLQTSNQTELSGVSNKTITPDDLREIFREPVADSQMALQTIQSPFDQLTQSQALSTSLAEQLLPVKPLNLSLPEHFEPQSLKGQPIGNLGKNKIYIGAHRKAFDTEGDALKFLHDQKKFRLDNQDFALVQSRHGTYHLYELKMPRFGLSDGRDLSSYKDLRSARFSSLPQQARLMGVLSEHLQFRAQTREAPVTAAFKPIPDPHPNDSLTSLRNRSFQALERLQTMESELGQVQDHRGIFAAMYRVITERGIEEMDKMIANGDKAGAEFEARLLVNFANKYFAAYDAYSAGNMQQVPEVWRSAFDAGRNAEATGYNRTSVTEVTALSMVAHIIHDLPLTLKEIGYKGDPHQEKVYDQFNGALMEEKNRIISAITRKFGPTDLDLIETAFRSVAQTVAKGCGERVALAVEQGIFSGMREIAKWQSQNYQLNQIESFSLRLSDASRLLPGGN